jgi:peptidoglycan/xylan/chitin deacetylase (PgdA/CDA1 family)
MKKIALALLCSVALATTAQTISFTFDDGLDPRVQPEAAEWNAQILAALKASKTTAMYFPAGKVVDSPLGLPLVKHWSEGGHAIGNHTYSHTALSNKKLTLEGFTADVLRADDLFKDLPGWSRRLRFPYLKEGDTVAKRDGVRQWMETHRYMPAPVSIDTSDWYFAERLLAWRERHPTQDPAPFKQAYLDHLWDRAQYYEKLATRTLGRSPSHVMLLHTNAINAAFLPDVLAMFKDKGWKIVSPLQAFGDPLYAQASSALPAGESIVWALAKQAGAPNLRYPAEDGEYEQPGLDALGL